MADETGLDRRDLIKATGAVGLALTAPRFAGAQRRPVRAGAGKDWYESPYRIVQTNLREPDILEDPERIARQVREFGGNAIVTNIGGIVAFYPTELDFQYRNPFMQDGVDFVQRMNDAARAQGLAVIGRFDLSKAMKPVYDAHPDWFMLSRDGAPRVFSGTYRACPNGDWAGDYGLQILREGLSRYEVDGVFFNMSGYPTTDYAHVDHGICVCVNCQRRFREMYGLDLPGVDGFDDPVWPQYLEFQDRTAAELNEKNYDVIKSLQPKAGVMGRYPFNEIVRGEVQRRVYRSPPEWAYQSGDQSRTYRARFPARPFSSTSTTHVDYPWRQALESGPYHMARFAQQLGTGSQLDLYLMGTFDDQDDRRFIAPVEELFHWHERNSAHYADVSTAARVALYESRRTERWGGGTASGRSWTRCFRGAYTALVDRRIPFSYVSDERIADGSVTLTPELFDVVILPGVVILTDAEAAALDAFVEAGGTVIATGQTGAFDGFGTPRSRMALESSPVAGYGETVDCHGWTFDAGRASGITMSPARIPATGAYYRVTTVSSTESLLPRAPNQRFGPPELSYALPDAPRGDEPGILLRRYGAGVSLHLPWHPEAQYYRDGLPDHAGLFAAMIEAYAPPPPVRLEGAGPVELMLLRQPATNRLLAHVVNYSGQRNGLYAEPARLHDLRIGVRGGGAARALVAGQDLSAGDADTQGYRWYTLPPVGYFEAVSVGLG